MNAVTAAISQAMTDDAPFDASLALLGSMFDACTVQVHFAPGDAERPTVHHLDFHDHLEMEIPRAALLEASAGARMTGDTWSTRGNELVQARYAAVPLIARGRPCGALGLLVEGPWEADDADLDVLASVGRELAAAMDHRREFRDALARASREALLNDVARVLDETPDTTVALTHALRDVSRWLGAAEGGVVTRVRGSRRLEILVRARTPGLGIHNENLDAEAVERLLLSVPAMVADRGDALLIGGAGEAPVSADVAALGVGAVLVAPLFAHRLPVGAVVIVADAGHRWGAVQRQVATRLAQQLGARLEADEVVRLQARRISELSGLARIGEVVQSTVDPVRLFRDFARATAEIVPFQRMFVALLPEDDGPSDVTQYDAEGHSTPVTASSDDLRHPWTTLRSATLMEASDGPPPSFLADVRSPIVIPMRPKGELLGVVAIDPIDGFDVEQLPLVAQAASQLALAIDSAALYRQATERAARIQVIGNLARIVASVVDLRDAFDAFADEVRWLIPFDRAVLFRVDPEIGLAEPYAACPADAVGEVGQRALSSSLIWEAYVERRPVRLRRDEAGPDNADWAILGDAAEAALLPVLRGHDCIAVLALSHVGDGGYTNSDIDALQEVGRLLAVTIEQVELFQQAEHTARHDVLTGLPNARYLQERLEALPVGQPDGACALLMLDMDDLKLFNDTLGHGVGDQVIAMVGEAVRASVRAEDFVACVAGDEFVALIRGAGAEEAQSVATRIHQQLRGVHHQIAGAPTDIRVSIGLACAPADAVSADDLVHAADVAMYAAKFAGGGRTASAGASLPDRFAHRSHGRPERRVDSVVRAATGAAAPREREGIALAQRYALSTALRMGVPTGESEVLRMLVARSAAPRLTAGRPGIDQSLSSLILDALASEWAGRDPQSAAVAQVVADTAVQLAWLQLPAPYGAGCSTSVAVERLGMKGRLALEAAVLQEMVTAIQNDDAGGFRLRAA